MSVALPDLVRPGLTGYLARPEDAQDLGNGILQLLENTPLRQAMSQRCREIACTEYSVNLEIQRHTTLYH